MLKKLLLSGVVIMLAHPVLAQETIKVGIISDMTGTYSDIAGPGAVASAQLAAKDFMEANPDVKIEIIQADHQNKPDLASSIARKWFDDENVDVIADVTSSSAALAVSNVAAEKNKVHLATNAASMDFSGPKCNANTVQWTYDAWGSAQVVDTITKPGDSWFFITADYTFGHSMEAMASDAVKKKGGKVLGSVRHPFNTADLSSFLLQAQSSGANTIGLANAGADFITTMKQSKEFGIKEGGQKLAALSVHITDFKAIGLEDSQGTTFVSTFYWDHNDKTREFTKRFEELRPGRVPTQGQAGSYSALLAYFDAVKAAGSAKDGEKVVKAMRDRGEFDDALFGRTFVRTDGRAVHPLLLVQIKSPAESKSPWDMYKILAELPLEKSARPLEESKAAGCKLVP